MTSLADHDVASLSRRLAELGAPTSHARRILRAYYGSHGRIDWAPLPISKGVKETLAAELGGPRAAVRTRHTSADGTSRLLLDLPAGGAVETVLMPAHRADRAAGCVSSQIGCAMGCDFCASTRGGFERNLAVGEIVEQFLHLSESAAELGRRVRSIVFMGMGEPLLNLENVIPAIERIADPDLGGVGWRQVTVSTVGIVPGIAALAEADLNVHLALSLHAPDDDTRARLIPMNRRYPVGEIVAAARAFQEKTRRIVTIEYTMLAGVNDSDDHARALARLVEGWRAHVNLIPYNPIGPGLSGKTYERPDDSRLATFLSILSSHKVVCHLRRTRGDDVNAACGQLREANPQRRALKVISSKLESARGCL